MNQEFSFGSCRKGDLVTKHVFDQFALIRYAFITFSAKEEADQAKQMMNGTTVCGQEIKVEILMLLMIIRIRERHFK